MAVTLRKEPEDLAEGNSRITREMEEIRELSLRQTADIEQLRGELHQAEARGRVQELRHLLDRSILLRRLASIRRDYREANVATVPRAASLYILKDHFLRFAAAFAASRRTRLHAWRMAWLADRVCARAVAPLIDLDRYRPEGISFNSREAASQHYANKGFVAAATPNGVFHRDYYLSRYPDVAASGIDPLLHYAIFGYSEERQPGPLFITDFYRLSSSSPLGLQNPIAHFLNDRDRLVSPHPLFDCTYFLKQCPAALKDSRHPLCYYLTEPGAWRCSTHVLFDAPYYLQQVYHLLAMDEVAMNMAPLQHFILEGVRLSLNPHPLFDLKHYVTTYPQARQPWVNPLVHFVEEGARSLMSAHPLFSAAFYCNQQTPSTDLLRNPLIHYLQSSRDTRKSPHPLFDEAFYLEQYADMLGANEAALLHYVRTGAREGCEPGPDFQTAHYLNEYSELKHSGETPLSHFVRTGLASTVVQDAERLYGKDALGASILTAAYRDGKVPTGRRGAPLCSRVVRRNASVSIVIAIHNGLPDVRRCLSSVLRRTLPPYELVLVDDGSDSDTCLFLATFADVHKAVLLRNDEARGYTRAANQGIQLARSPYISLLNSDAVVSELWLDRLVACAESDRSIGIAGPLSNTASWQSVPELLDGPDWASNELPPTMTIEDMALHVASTLHGYYPLLPLLNGFCLLVRRELLQAIGMFDEELFGSGYGEENDYCLRATNAGWKLALAADTYVFHSQSKSYGRERRLHLTRLADANLRAKYGDERVEYDVRALINSLPLAAIRSKVKASFERAEAVQRYKAKYEGKRVAFVLPVRGAGGGANLVLTQAMAMRRFGVDVRIVNLADHKSQFEESYPECDLEVVYGSGVKEVVDLCKGYDSVVGTLYKSVHWLRETALGGSASVGYYVQDFEPHFFPSGTAEYGEALRSYSAFPGLLCFTTTEWNRQEVFQHTGVCCSVVGPSFDSDLFKPRCQPASADDPIKIIAMIRPESPRRAPKLTVEILNLAVRKYGSRIDVTLFGTDSIGYETVGEEFCGGMRKYGKLRPDQCADLFASQDIFIDLSSYQAMGLTAMECMASGCVVMVPEKGGCSSFATHEANAMLVDTSDPESCFRSLERLVEDFALREKLRTAATASIPFCYAEKSAGKILEVLFASSEAV